MEIAPVQSMEYDETALSASEAAQEEENRILFSNSLATAMTSENLTPVEEIVYTGLQDPAAITVTCGGRSYNLRDLVDMISSVDSSYNWSGGGAPVAGDMQRGASSGIHYRNNSPISWPTNDDHPANRGVMYYDLFGGAARVYDFTESDWDTVKHHMTHNGEWLERFGYQVAQIGEGKLLAVQPQMIDGLLNPNRYTGTGIAQHIDTPKTVTRHAAATPETGSTRNDPRFLRFY